MNRIISVCLKIELCLLPIFVLIVFYSCKDKTGLPYGTDAAVKNAVNKLQQESVSNPQQSILLSDSLLKRSEGLSKSAKLKIHIERQKAFAAIQEMDSVIVSGTIIRDLASGLNDSLAIALSLLPVRGDIGFEAQKEMELYLPGAISAFGKAKMPSEQARASATYGAILCQKGDFKKAQDYLLRAYDYFSYKDSLRPLINICINIGNAYSGINSIEKAKSYYNKALGIAKQFNDSMTQVSVYMNYGTLFAQTQPDSALKFYQEALHVLPSNAPYYIKMKIDYNVAEADYALANYNSAEAVYQKMLVQCVTNGLLEGEVMARKGIAEVYNKTGKNAQAVLHLTRAVELADSLGMNIELMAMRSELVTSYKALGDYKNALTVAEKRKVMSDSLLSKEKLVAVHELEEKYKEEKKELENDRLKDHLKARKTIIIILIIAIVVLLILGRQRNRLYKERAHSYEILIKKYRAEKAEKSILLKNSDILLEENDSLSQENTTESSLTQKLIHYYDTEKPYLNPKLKVQDVALYLELTDKEISAAIKLTGDTNFAAFTNKYRVETARKLFEDSSLNHLKLEVIAEMAGFGNRQNLYNAFEQVTGVKPGFYRKQMQEHSEF